MLRWLVTPIASGMRSAPCPSIMWSPSWIAFAAWRASRLSRVRPHSRQHAARDEAGSDAEGGDSNRTDFGGGADRAADEHAGEQCSEQRDRQLPDPDRRALVADRAAPVDHHGRLLRARRVDDAERYRRSDV